MPINRRSVVAMMSLTPALLVASRTVTRAGAQESTPAPSADQDAADIGVVDAGSRTVWNLSDPEALVYTLTVLEFEDVDRAASAFQLIVDGASDALANNAATPDAVATTIAGLEETDIDLGDDSILYYQPDESGSAGIATLFVLIGVYVHQWATLPVPLQENTLRIDPASLPEALLALADPWFAEEHDGDAIAQLPNLDQFADGYEVLNESSGLGQLAPASPVAAP